MERKADGRRAEDEEKERKGKRMEVRRSDVM